MVENDDKSILIECTFFVHPVPGKTDEVALVFLTVLRILLCRNTTFPAE